MKNNTARVLGAILAFCVALAACQTEQDLTYARYYTVGKQGYETHCQNCHGEKGEGLAALIPPLTDTAYLSRRKDKLACVIKMGLKEEITVAGKTFDEEMPGVPQLTDIDIAAIITYVTNSFGNKQGLKDQAAVKADLQNCISP